MSKTNTKVNKKKQILTEQKLNTILLETYQAKDEVVSGSPIIGSFEVAITEAGEKNANGRVYPHEVWLQPDSFQVGGKYLDENGKLRPLSLLGYVDHPTENQLEVLLEKAAIAYSELNLNENVWTGKVNILNTPGGKIVKTFLDYAKEFGGGEQIGVSTRADGSTTIVESAGEVYEQVDPDGFYLAAIDFVYNPSSFVANSPTLLESKKRTRTLLENISDLAKEDEEHKQDYIDFVNKLKQGLGESASLDRAKQAYLKNLKEQEYKLHQAIYEIEQMDNEEFNRADISDTLDRDQFLRKLVKEHRKLIKEIDKEEGLLENMTKEKETKTKEELKEQEVLKEQDEEELEELKDDEEEPKEDDIDEPVDVEDDKDEEDIKDEEEITLKDLNVVLNELMMKVDYISDWLFELDDVEGTFETDGIEPVEEIEDEDLTEFTDEDLDDMTDEELEALFELAGEEPTEEDLTENKRKLNENKKDNYFEVLYYVGKTEEEAMRGDFVDKHYKTEAEAMKAYEALKRNKTIHGLWVTERNADGELVKDIKVD